MLSRFHDTRGEHGFDSHSSPGFQPDHSRSGWDYLLENWSHPRISTKVSNYFKTLKGENAFWRANWIITPLEGISPFEAAITGEEAGKEVERSRITSDDQEEKEAALKVYFGCLLIHHLADGPSILCKPPWPTSGGARPEDGVPDHLQAAGLQLHRFFHPFIHRPTPYSQRIAEGSWNDSKVKKTIFGKGWVFGFFFIFFQGDREDELVHPQLSRHQRSSQRNDCFLSQPDLFNKLTPMLPSIHKSSWIFIKFSEERTIQL